MKTCRDCGEELANQYSRYQYCEKCRVPETKAPRKKINNCCFLCGRALPDKTHHHYCDVCKPKAKRAAGRRYREKIRRLQSKDKKLINTVYYDFFAEEIPENRSVLHRIRKLLFGFFS